MYKILAQRLEELANDNPLMLQDGFALYWVRGTIQKPFIEKVNEASSDDDWLKNNLYTTTDGKLGAIFTDSALIPKPVNECTQSELELFLQWLRKNGILMSEVGYLPDEAYAALYSTVCDQVGTPMLEACRDEGGPNFLVSSRLTYMFLNNTESLLIRDSGKGLEFFEDPNKYPTDIVPLSHWCIQGMTLERNNA